MAATLADGVRRRVVEIASEVLGALPAEQVPAALRRISRFDPVRRARIAATPIAAALDSDERFRAAVVQRVRVGYPDVVAALESGSPLPAADPSDVAALAYLLDAAGWESWAAAAAEHERTVANVRDSERSRDQDDRVRARSEAQAQARSAELTAARAQVAELRTELATERAAHRRSRQQAAVATAAGHEAAQRLLAAQADAARELAGVQSEQRRLAAELAETKEALSRARREDRRTRQAVDARRWLLLDTIARSARGLRDELDLGPTQWRPADDIGTEPAAAAGSARPGDDPAAVDQLLTLPHAHLVVDGYNVTKTGYPGLALSDQRTRLVAALVPLAARTGAEVTCVFDGSDVVAAPPGAGRGVRVRFSPPGQIADELIRAIVAAEPVGRPVTVCTADREILDAVSRDGAWTLTPTALLSRLDRG